MSISSCHSTYRDENDNFCSSSSDWSSERSKTTGSDGPRSSEDSGSDAFRSCAGGSSATRGSYGTRSSSFSVGSDDVGLDLSSFFFWRRALRPVWLSYGFTDSSDGCSMSYESSFTGSSFRGLSSSSSFFLSYNFDDEAGGNGNDEAHVRYGGVGFSSGLSCSRSLGDRCSSSGSSSDKRGDEASRTSFGSWTN